MKLFQKLGEREKNDNYKKINTIPKVREYFVNISSEIYYYIA